MVLLLTATLAGCGDSGSDGTTAGGSTRAGTSASGGGTASASYEQAGARLCRRLFDQNRALPQQQADEGLSVKQAQARAKQHGDRFLIDFAALKPTGDDRAAHDRLVAVLRMQATEPPAKDPDTAIRVLERTAKAYETAGQTTCGRLVRTGIAELRSAARTSPRE
ncbi:hypothetical protein [Patulibacter minatonensis]|uniref:hypothetical protein n=1 Tax=Patulibacter minatonensis TaxID=298163 RepID=UPI00047880A2|nr:hypothetical protein [Patulibacter minatonensis]